MAAILTCVFEGVQARTEIDDDIWSEFLAYFGNPVFGYTATVPNPEDPTGPQIPNHPPGKLAFDWLMQRVFEKAQQQNSAHLNSLKPTMDDYTFTPVTP